MHALIQSSLLPAAALSLYRQRVLSPLPHHPSAPHALPCRVLPKRQSDASEEDDVDVTVHSVTSYVVNCVAQLMDS